MHDLEPINFINIIITANIWYYAGMIYMGLTSKQKPTNVQDGLVPWMVSIWSHFKVKPHAKLQLSKSRLILTCKIMIFIDICCALNRKCSALYLVLFHLSKHFCYLYTPKLVPACSDRWLQSLLSRHSTTVCPIAIYNYAGIDVISR